MVSMLDLKFLANCDNTEACTYQKRLLTGSLMQPNVEQDFSLIKMLQSTLRNWKNTEIVTAMTVLYVAIATCQPVKHTLLYCHV